MHPLELFDRFRRWLGWVSPGCQLWERKPQQVPVLELDFRQGAGGRLRDCSSI